MNVCSYDIPSEEFEDEVLPWKDVPSMDLSPEFLLDQKESYYSLIKALSQLPPVEADALCRRYGLYDEEESSLYEIGYSWGVSQTRARDVVERALRRMRSKRNKHIALSIYPKEVTYISLEQIRAIADTEHELLRLKNEELKASKQRREEKLRQEQLREEQRRKAIYRTQVRRVFATKDIKTVFEFCAQHEVMKNMVNPKYALDWCSYNMSKMAGLDFYALQEGEYLSEMELLYWDSDYVDIVNHELRNQHVQSVVKMDMCNGVKKGLILIGTLHSIKGKFWVPSYKTVFLSYDLIAQRLCV